MECVFCEIVDRGVQEVVYTDGAVVAFLCEPPAVWGHVLVVPRRHAADIWEVEERELVAVTRASKRLADALRVAVGAEGVSLRHNSGDASGQDVPHFHLHVIPRHDGDALGPACVWGLPPWTPPEGGVEKRLEVAQAIRVALSS